MTNNFFTCTTVELGPISDLILQVLRKVKCYPWFICVHSMLYIMLHSYL
jgi:hypothetical protein